MASHRKLQSDVECRTCVHYRVKMGYIGECRRFPPQVIFDVNEDAKDNAFPMVREKDYCGEWMSKDLEDYDDEEIQ